MANAFDQFDQVAANPFDQFEPAQPSQDLATESSPISEDVTSFLKGARSSVPYDERVARFNALKAQGLDDRAAMQRAAFDQNFSLSGIAGAIPTVASSVVAEPVAGLAGLAATPFVGAEGGAQTVEKVRESLTIPPVGEEAEKTLGAVGQALEPLASIPGKAGGAVFEATGSPAAAAAVETGIAAIPEALGLKGASQVRAAKRLSRMNRELFNPDGMPSPAFQKALDKKGLSVGALIGEEPTLPVTFGKKTPDEIVDSIIAKKLKAGDQSEDLFQYKLSSGQVVDDDWGQEAFKQGFKKGDIASAKTANRPTKNAMAEMLRKKQAIESNPSRALDFRPSDEIGKSAIDRFNFIRDEAKILRRQLDKIAKKTSKQDAKRLEGPNTVRGIGGLEINTGQVVDDYLDGLDDLQIDVDMNQVPPKLDFSQSLISEDKTSQKVINSITRILSKEGAVDAGSAHLLKRQIDTMLDFNKKSPAGLTDAGKSFAKNIRASINQSIRDVSPEYAAVNDRLSRAIGALEDFDKALGSGVDAFSDSAPKAVGTTLRRLQGNVQSRVALDDALTNLENNAKALGGVFDTDIKRLITFNQALDDRFGATARSSFQGGIESAINAGPEQAVKNIMTQKAAEKIESLRGINNENAFKAMRKVIQSN